MSPEDIRTAIRSALLTVAPEADLDSLGTDEDMRDALDLDSMDILRFATTLHEQLDVDIPESDYSKIVTLAGCAQYLQKRLAPTGATRK